MPPCHAYAIADFRHDSLFATTYAAMLITATPAIDDADASPHYDAAIAITSH